MVSSAPRWHPGWFAVLALLLGACAVGSLGGSSTPEACPAALLEGELLRDDDSGFLVRHAEGFVTPIVWPEGYTVRDGETRELLDSTGAVVAREGDFVALGGGFTVGDTAFIVCGPFRVNPQE